MFRRTVSLPCVLIIVAACISPATPARACGAYIDLELLPVEAVSTHPETARRAIATLRTLGPAGLEALMTAHAAAIDAHRADPTKCDARWQRIAAALETVAAQKDAWAAGLYWYTDLERAKWAATAQRKPILSLRLLGTLDAEFSCANSRFFRTALYPNAQVRKYLKDNFVLHWQSHRPVPKLTIDFGDGRKIERTITGNSVHYVLTPDGRVVDVLPGLYGPAAFLRGLAAAQQLVNLHESPDFGTRLAQYHQQRLAAASLAWVRDLRAVKPNAMPAIPVNAKPTAAAAARIAVSKSAVELRPVVAIAPDRGSLASATDDATWAAIAARHADDGTLDAGSRAVIVSKGVPDAVAAGERALSKRKVEDPVVRLIRNFERSVAEDTVRNEYLLHSQVHQWFAGGAVPASLDDLNEKVYAELFLMPRSDPWLGLVPGDAYTALPKEATVGVK
jgi:hypothetical protein